MAQVWRGIIWFSNGYRHYGKSGYERRAQHFNADDLQSVEGKVFVVTGANAGLGKSTSLSLAKLGGEVHMVCRNKERGEAAQAEIKEESNNSNIHLHLCDVSKTTDIREFAKEFIRSRKPLHCLINNAGVMLNNRSETEEGIESTFATNTIGTYLMTQMLLPVLKRTTTESGQPARVVIVSSGGMLTQKMNVNDFETTRGYDGTLAYAQTKRHQVYLCEEFATIEPSVKFFSMHPGWSDTPGVQSSMPAFREKTKNMLRSEEQGADTIVWLAVCQNEQLMNQSGLFFLDREPVTTHLKACFTQSSREDIDLLLKTCKEKSKFEDDEANNLELEAAQSCGGTTTTTTTTTSTTTTPTTTTPTTSESSTTVVEPESTTTTDEPTTTTTDEPTTTTTDEPATASDEPTTTESEPTTTTKPEPITAESEPTTTDEPITTTESETTTTTEPETTTTTDETTTTTDEPAASTTNADNQQPEQQQTQSIEEHKTNSDNDDDTQQSESDPK